VEAGGEADRARQQAGDGQKRGDGRRRGEPPAAVEQKAERACELLCREAKWQARNVDPGMDSVKAEAVVGERKAVTSDRSCFGERLRRALKR